MNGMDMSGLLVSLRVVHVVVPMLAAVVAEPPFRKSYTSMVRSAMQTTNVPSGLMAALAGPPVPIEVRHTRIVEEGLRLLTSYNETVERPTEEIKYGWWLGDSTPPLH